MGFRRDPDWTNLESFKNYLDKSGKTYGNIDKRIDMTRERFRQERLAQESIVEFWGDGLSEGDWEMQLQSLINKKDEGVDVKILSKWDSKSPKLIKVIDEYVDKNFQIRRYSGDIRGGAYDKKRMYLLETHLGISLQELSPRNIDELPKKTIGESQKDEHAPLAAMVVYDQDTTKRFYKEFIDIYKSATSMKTELEKLEKAIYNDEQNIDTKISNKITGPSTILLNI